MQAAGKAPGKKGGKAGKKGAGGYRRPTTVKGRQEAAALRAAQKAAAAVEEQESGEVRIKVHVKCASSSDVMTSSPLHNMQMTFEIRRGASFPSNPGHTTGVRCCCRSSLMRSRHLALRQQM